MNKNTRLRFLATATFLLIQSAVFAQLPEPTQEFRGLWVTQFRTNVLGDGAAEDALVAYAAANGFNYLICTNMFQILTADCGSFTAEMVELRAFVAKAHAGGIAYVSGNVGSLATAEKIQDYNDCVSVADAEKLDMITYECEFYNAATNGSCPGYASFIDQLTDIKTICTSTDSSVPGRPLVCEAYIGGEGATGLVLTYSSEAEMEAIAGVADHVLMTYYRSMPSNSGGNFFNWTIDRLEWLAKTGTPSNVVLLLKSRNTDGNNMNAYLAAFPGTHFDAVRDPYLSWVEGTVHDPTLAKGYRERYLDGTYPWLSGIQVKGFTWFEHLANMALGPLPVEFAAFDVAKTPDNHALLRWTTATESNNDFFEVQNAVDGTHWQYVARVPAKGNSTAAQHYTFVDSRPHPGTSYYRLKQIDTDGQASYSMIKSVAFGTSNPTTLFPNPVADVLHISKVSTDAASIAIFNARGQKMEDWVVRHQSTGVDVDVSRLPVGFYVVVVNGEHLKLVKQ